MNVLIYLQKFLRVNNACSATVARDKHTNVSSNWQQLTNVIQMFNHLKFNTNKSIVSLQS